MAFRLFGLTSSRTRLAFVVLPALLVLPVQAGARSWTVDIKAHPSVFKENTEVDVPLYLVENRAPDSEPQSQFSKYPIGIRDVRFDLGSTQSRFVSFTPVGVWDGRGTQNPSAEGFEVYRNSIITNSVTGTTRNKLYVSLYATGGAAVMPDNSGITGRTELLLGTLRIAVGTHTQVTPERKIVLDVVANDDPTGPVDGVEMWSSLPPAWGLAGAATMPTRQMRFFLDGNELEGIAPGDGSTQPPGGTPLPDPGPQAPDAGPQAPSVSALRFGGTLRAPRRATRAPFSVLKKAPKKGTPAIKLTLNAPVALKATLAKAGAKGRMVRLAGSATVKQATTTLYLKLSGSWNKKRLAKGTYRMAFTAPGAKVKSVTFRVR